MRISRKSNRGQVVFEYFILFVLIAAMSIIVSSNRFSSHFKGRMDSFMGGAMGSMEQNGISVPANGMHQTPWVEGDLDPNDNGTTTGPGWGW